MSEKIEDFNSLGKKQPTESSAEQFVKVENAEQLRDKLDQRHGIIYKNHLSLSGIADLKDGTPVSLGYTSNLEHCSVKKVSIGDESNDLEFIATKHGWKRAKIILGEEIYEIRKQILPDSIYSREKQLAEHYHEGLDTNFKSTAVTKEGIKMPEHDQEKGIADANSWTKALLKNGELVGFSVYTQNSNNYRTEFVPVDDELRKLWEQSKYNSDSELLDNNMDNHEAQPVDKSRRDWPVIDLRTSKETDRKKYIRQYNDIIFNQRYYNKCVVLLDNRFILPTGLHCYMNECDSSNLPQNIKSMEFNKERWEKAQKEISEFKSSTNAFEALENSARSRGTIAEWK